ncbi:MAG: phage terminase small subunit-related protein [Clostridium sp.]|nr:phage terminase small subunit-related protein [Clostridium sp.]
MPRLPNEKINEAEMLYKSGMKLVDISKKLGVPEGTVRRWKHDKNWDGKSKKKQSERSDKNSCEKANVRKRGAPNGNKNAKGGKGNPHPNSTKHGAYRPVFMDALDEDEQALVGGVPEDEEMLLIEQIQLFSIRERRILQAINKYREQNGDVTVADVTRFEEKRTFKNKEEEADYEKRIEAKVSSGDRLPGKSFNIQTHTSNKDMIIARLEQELSTVQSKKTKAIETLSKIRIEKIKMDREVAGNDVVDDWIAGVLGEGGADEQK